MKLIDRAKEILAEKDKWKGCPKNATENNLITFYCPGHLIEGMEKLDSDANCEVELSINCKECWNREYN